MPAQYYAKVKITDDSRNNAVLYEDANHNPIPALSGRPGDRVQFSIQDLRSKPDPNGGDLVLIGQYSNPGSAPGSPKTPRRIPFAGGGGLARYIQQGSNDWNLTLTGPIQQQTFFEYAVVALLDSGATMVPIDPSIIINPPEF